MITHIGKQAHVARRSDTAFHLHKCVARFVSDSWVCWWSVVLIVIKISPCLSQLQLAKFSVFYWDTVYILNNYLAVVCGPLQAVHHSLPPSVRPSTAGCTTRGAELTVPAHIAHCTGCVWHLCCLAERLDWTGLPSTSISSSESLSENWPAAVQCRVSVRVCVCVCGE